MFVFVFGSVCVCFLPLDLRRVGVGGVETAAWSLCVITKSYVLPGCPNDGEQIEAKLRPTFPPGDAP